MATTPLLSKLNLLDRLLSLWIALAAGLGLALGQLHGVQDFIGSTTLSGGTNVLVAIGLIVMMYPPLAKVRWNVIHRVLADWKLLVLTTFQNWVLGPFVMYLLVAAFFHNDPGYMAGLSLVGCARCIAMVVVWNALAGGDDEYCAAIVAINSLLTIALYSPYAALFLNELPKQMSLQSFSAHVSLGEVAKNVGIYMGVPFVLGLATWFLVGRVWKDDVWYRTTFTPRIGVLTLLALLFTVVVLFATQSERITENAGKVLYAAVPLLIYFLVMFLLSFGMSTMLGATYPQSVALAFTAASNNFELALAVAIASFGLKSDPALMSVIGALIEIPTMLTLVHLAFWFRDHLTFTPSATDLEIQEGLVDGDAERSGGDERSATGELKPKAKQHANASSDAVYVAVADA